MRTAFAFTFLTTSNLRACYILDSLYRQSDIITAPNKQKHAFEKEMVMFLFVGTVMKNKMRTAFAFTFLTTSNLRACAHVPFFIHSCTS
jgi:hypothetical protein